jgi:hypothetical protein
LSVDMPKPEERLRVFAALDAASDPFIYGRARQPEHDAKSSVRDVFSAAF